MIISYSRKFCFIRVPKAGSTTISMALVDSGILDKQRDYVSYSSEFQKKIYHNQCIPWQCEQILRRKDRTHQRADDYRQMGLLPDNFRIISTIRHPVDRFLSTVKFLFKHTDPNQIWDSWPNPLEHETLFTTVNLLNRIIKPQHWWFGEGAELWPVENIDQLLWENFGIKNTSRYRESDRQLVCDLTEDRKQAIMDYYSQDLLLHQSVTSNSYQDLPV